MTMHPNDPRRPDPNAVKIAEGTWLHHGLYLRGSATAGKVEPKCVCWKPTEPQRDCPRHKEAAK